MTGYTVIDVETTGLVPDRHDRVIEIGVVYVSPHGRIQDQWSTLINPGRDVGPTKIHGLTASDVVGAPRFEELSPYILRAVAGRTLVAHNASFDLRFLAAEFCRVGVSLRQLPLQGVCTMQWSTTYLVAPSRRLVDCCRACGISLENAHSAQADALATARLLSHYIQQAQNQPPWTDILNHSTSYPWPEHQGPYPDTHMVRREHVRTARPDTWLDAIVARMPRAANTRVDNYLAVLEMAMLDGFLAEHEKDELIEAAAAVGLTRGQVLDVHGDYLRAMAEVALADHVVTSAERAELDSVALMLGLRAGDVDKALGDARSRAVAETTAVDTLTTAVIDLEPGDRVVFTGDLNLERGQWEARARSAGATASSTSTTSSPGRSACTSS